MASALYGENAFLGVINVITRAAKDVAGVTVTGRAAVKAGVLKEGEKVRFGFHNLRHSLASFLVRKRTDVKTGRKCYFTATFPPR